MVLTEHPFSFTISGCETLHQVTRSTDLFEGSFGLYVCVCSSYDQNRPGTGHWIMEIEEPESGTTCCVYGLNTLQNQE